MVRRCQPAAAVAVLRTSNTLLRLSVLSAVSSSPSPLPPPSHPVFMSSRSYTRPCYRAACRGNPQPWCTFQHPPPRRRTMVRSAWTPVNRPPPSYRSFASLRTRSSPAFTRYSRPQPLRRHHHRRLPAVGLQSSTTQLPSRNSLLALAAQLAMSQIRQSASTAASTGNPPEPPADAECSPSGHP